METKFQNLKARQFIGYAICAAGFAITVAAFYPGLLTSDSIASLGEGRSGIIYDQNSAVMSYLLGVLDGIVPGTGLMLILQVAVFWIAIACLWHLVYPRSFPAAVAIVIFPFLPQVLSQIPVIWKDVGMAIALLMAVTLVFVARRTGSKTALFLSPLFLFYGFAARLNALPAVLPIAIWTGIVAVSILQLRVSGFMPAVIGLGYFVVLLGVVQIFNSAVTEGRTSYPFQFVLLHDLAAISAVRNEPAFPDYITKRQEFSLELVKQNYSPVSIGKLVYRDHEHPEIAPVLTTTEDRAQMGALWSKWRGELTANPVAYLRHRLSVFAALLGLSRSVTNQYANVSFNPPEYSTNENFITATLRAYFRSFVRPVMQTFFFRGFIWLAACAYFGYRAIKAKARGDWSFVLVLALSSLLYVAAYLPTAPAADFRYIFWPAIASGIAIIFGIYLLRQERAIPAAEV